MRRFLIAGLGALIPMVWKELQKSLLKDYVVQPLRRWGAALLGGIRDLFGLDNHTAPAGPAAPAPTEPNPGQPAPTAPPCPCDEPGTSQGAAPRAPDTRSPGDALDGPLWDAFTRAVQAEATPLPAGEPGEWGQELARRRRLETQAVPRRVSRSVSQRLTPSRSTAAPAEGWTKGLASPSRQLDLSRPHLSQPQPEVWHPGTAPAPLIRPA